MGAFGVLICFFSCMIFAGCLSIEISPHAIDDGIQEKISSFSSIASTKMECPSQEAGVDSYNVCRQTSFLPLGDFKEVRTEKYKKSSNKLLDGILYYKRYLELFNEPSGCLNRNVSRVYDDTFVLTYLFYFCFTTKTLPYYHHSCLSADGECLECNLVGNKYCRGQLVREEIRERAERCLCGFVYSSFEETQCVWERRSPMDKEIETIGYKVEDFRVLHGFLYRSQRTKEGERFRFIFPCFTQRSNEKDATWSFGVLYKLFRIEKQLDGTYQWWIFWL